MDKKYEMLVGKENTIKIGTHTLHRIRALKDFDIIKAGDIGGYIEKEENLSHEGNAWVHDDAKVYKNAWISENAHVYGNAEVFGNALVYGNARVAKAAAVSGNAYVHNDAQVLGYSHVTGNARVYGNAWVYGDAQVTGNARVYGNAKVYDNAVVREEAKVYGDAVIYKIAELYGNVCICNNARIVSEYGYLLFKGFGRENRFTTFYKCADGNIRVVCGCFNGNLEEFEKEVKETHGDNIYAKEYLTILDLVKIHFRLE